MRGHRPSCLSEITPRCRLAAELQDPRGAGVRRQRRSCTMADAIRDRRPSSRRRRTRDGQLPAGGHQSVGQPMAPQSEGGLDPYLGRAQKDLRRKLLGYLSSAGYQLTKYDLGRVRDSPGELLREYIRHFSDTRTSIPNISDDEAVEAFIKGLRHHDALRSKLLRKRPKTINDLLKVAKAWADADDGPTRIRAASMSVGWRR